jgi:hypothetical protein
VRNIPHSHMLFTSNKPLLNLVIKYIKCRILATGDFSDKLFQLSVDMPQYTEKLCKHEVQHCHYAISSYHNNGMLRTNALDEFNSCDRSGTSMHRL